MYEDRLLMKVLRSEIGDTNEGGSRWKGVMWDEETEYPGVTSIVAILHRKLSRGKQR